MNYKESAEILSAIESSERILLVCHPSPDPDSVGSNLAMREVLQEMNKKVSVVCEYDIPRNLTYLPGAENIEKVNFSNLDFKAFDLFIALDMGSWDRVVDGARVLIPDFQIIKIDHHEPFDDFGHINLVKPDMGAACEVLFCLFGDWNVEIGPNLANCLLTGIIGDTGSFQFGFSAETLKISAELMEKGANKLEITTNLYRDIDFSSVETLGLLFSRLKKDPAGFVWTSLSCIVEDISYESLNTGLVDVMLQSIKNTDFGIRIIESEKDNVKVSFRSHIGFDVSKIARDLGGGGHKSAAATTIKGVSLDDTIDRVLQVAKKHVEKI